TDAANRTGALQAVTIGDATVRQNEPRFGAESTVRDEAADDDTSLLLSVEERFSYADVVRPTIAQLTINGGDHAGKQFPLSEPEYLIGRHRDNTIQLADLGVSGCHSRIYRGPDGYVLEDLKSRNGTWVNGTRIFHTTLAHGDKVHVGQTDLIYELLF
ncbi:MAG TPA: FHA domain-containing protein, partial [Thermoanaerobaculia bacterium]